MKVSNVVMGFEPCVTERTILHADKNHQPLSLSTWDFFHLCNLLSIKTIIMYNSKVSTSCCISLHFPFNQSQSILHKVQIMKLLNKPSKN